LSKSEAGSEKFKVFKFLTINYLGFAIITTLSSFLPAVAYHGKRRQRPWDYSWGFFFLLVDITSHSDIIPSEIRSPIPLPE
jgi:hypothetical protein